MRQGALRPAQKPETEETQYREDQLVARRAVFVRKDGSSFTDKGYFVGAVDDLRRPEIVIDELGAYVLVWVKK